MPPQHRLTACAWRLVGALVGGLLLMTACTVGSSPHHSAGGSLTAPISTAGPSSGTSDDPSTDSPPSTESNTPTTTPSDSRSATAPSTGVSTPTKSGVDLIVTYSGWNAGPKTAEVDAFAPDVLVSNAKCTLTLTRGGVTRTASRSASPSASSTQCGALTIAGSQLVSGDWTAVVRFESPRAAGSTDPVTIRVTE